MVEAKNNGSSHWWWLDSQTKGKTNRSPWLQSTLAELDEKTRTMLKIIENDADSFAQRAEMYYRKRPELITMVEDLYRTHRLLAEKYDQFKSESGTPRFSLTFSSSSPLSPRFKSESGTPRLPMAYSSTLSSTKSLDEIKSFDSYSEAYGPEEESDESEVDDPEEELVQENLFSENEELIKLREEVKRLKEENKAQKEQLEQKDDEKREVIRQLTSAMDLIREANTELRKKCVTRNNTKKESPVEFNKLKDNFFGKLFSGFTKGSNLVAL